MTAAERTSELRTALRPPRARFRARFVAFTVALALLVPALASAQGAGSDSLTLTWTAPGDDGTFGTAFSYDFRISTSPIPDDNFDAATAIDDVPPPMPASTRQAMIVRALTRGVTYYFAARVYDEVGNWSPLSNIARWNWPIDHSPPAAPANLSATQPVAGRTIRLAWGGNSESDLAGYIVYRARFESGPWERLNAALLRTPGYEDDAVPEGASDLWYTVSAADAAGNESPRARLLRVGLATPALPPTAWKLLPPFPNPARLDQTTHLPVEVP